MGDCFKFAESIFKCQVMQAKMHYNGIIWVWEDLHRKCRFVVERIILISEYCLYQAHLKSLNAICNANDRQCFVSLTGPRERFRRIIIGKAALGQCLALSLYLSALVIITDQQTNMCKS